MLQRTRYSDMRSKWKVFKELETDEKMSEVVERIKRRLKVCGMYN